MTEETIDALRVQCLPAVLPRHCQCLFDCPATGQPSAYRRFMEPCPARPSGQVVCNSRMFQQFCHRGVPALLSACGPAAIRWRVRSVVVDPIYRVPWWAWPHVAQERLKAVTPRIAHEHTPCPIAWIANIVRIGATLFGCRPRRKFMTCVTTSRVPVDQMTSLTAAPATLRVPAPERICNDFCDGPTIASASPRGMAPLVRRSFGDDQATEAHASAINQRREHGPYRSGSRPRLIHG
jgi:hypothetical protein